MNSAMNNVCCDYTVQSAIEVGWQKQIFKTNVLFKSLAHERFGLRYYLFHEAYVRKMKYSVSAVVCMCVFSVNKTG